MSESELSDVAVEIEGIAKQICIRGRDLRVLDTDTEVAATRDYRGAASMLEVAGRGGTDMGAGIAAAVKLRPSPNAIVVITDGFPFPHRGTRALKRIERQGLLDEPAA
jgi:predicted metal-dependent peptidase